MRNVRFGCIIFCALAVASGCRVLSPDWNGTWKLNVPKSSFQDQAITISTLADGEYRYDDGFVSSTFRCDGVYRPIPIGNNRTQAWRVGHPSTSPKRMQLIFRVPHSSRLWFTRRVRV